MTIDQMASAAVLACTLALFIWGRWRFDLVAVTALSVSVLIGIVQYDDAFLGFSHPAVITVAIVLILSRAIANSGVVEELAGRIAPVDGPVWVQMSAFCGLGAVLSAFMNNVGALALLMPAVIATAARANRSPSLFLMPLAFASMLGGLITLSGTPAN
ncbi:MAG TPA: SLC13 family permease, partial [Methylomirabilota bacterium]|nr:SLC13 family permease [Methylomirabilota bacterium]